MEDHSYAVSRTVLATGDVLLLYTDGVVERRDRDIGEGIDALRAALARSAGEPLEQVLRSLLAAHSGPAPYAHARSGARTGSALEDDACLLALGVQGVPGIQGVPGVQGVPAGPGAGPPTRRTPFDGRADGPDR